MKAVIFHNINLAVAEDIRSIVKHQHCNPDHFKFVGQYEDECDSLPSFLNQTFEKTNSIDCHWSLNKGVQGGKGQRSSSVGDMFLVNDSDVYCVCNVGFRQVEDDELIRSLKNQSV